MRQVLDAVGVEKVWKYDWKVQRCSEQWDLERRLRELEDEGYEIFSINLNPPVYLKTDYREGRFIITARKPVLK